MKNEDAAKVLGLSGNLTKEIIKKAYKKACSLYHPDKGGSLEMMQAVNQAYDVLKDFEGSLELEDGDSDYGEKLNEALSKIIGLDGLIIEVCGAWVWVTGETRKYKKELGKDGAGFFWANKKKAWYYRPSGFKSSSRGSYSLDEIRSTYGSSKVKNTRRYLSKSA